MGTIPTVATFTAGSVVTAAYLNSLKAAVDFWANTPRVSAYRSTAQSIPNAGSGAVVLLNAETYDIVQSGDSPMHDNSTNSSRLIARTTGKYMVAGQIQYASNATGARSAIVRKNAAGAVGGGTEVTQNIQAAVSANATTVPFGPVEISMNAGDYIEMFAYQTSGGSLDLGSGISATYMSLRLVAN